MPILFNRCASLQVDSIISTSARSITSSSQRCCLHPFQVDFVFPTHPPFFFEDSDFLINYPFYRWKSLHSYLVFLMKILMELLVHHSSFFFFSSGLNSSVIDHIFFLVSNTLSCRCSSFSFTSRYSFVTEC